ncbi:MAG: DNA methyltransferase [Terracidiphilus sp.]|jgi:type II restriction/modification system DNA methylase subunit YeeA
MKPSLPEFIRCWKDSELTERAGAQSHFNDLCDILNEPHPAHADPKGAEYTFEKRVNKIGEDKGFADVWKRGFFGWEYKGPHKDLKAAYLQLLRYREDLENPPLLVVCDFVQFEVHTNFTNTPPVVHKFTLDDLILTTPVPGSDLSALDILRAVFQEPEKLKPGALEVRVTQKAAEEFTKLKDNLRRRHADNEAVARFVMQLLFCLFADSVGLLPDNLFRKTIQADRQEPKKFVRKLKKLFAAMATGDSEFGFTAIHHFNGGLFRAGDDTVFDLTHEDMGILRNASQLDWGRVEPAIFGTLFERILNEEKRAQLGAHYTSREDILLIVEPVIMAPLRRRWAEVKAGAQEIAAAIETASNSTRAKLRAQLEAHLLGWMDELAAVRILDPACGSGNFLYVALKLLLDLWRETQIFSIDHHLAYLPCKVGPSQLYGIETNVYAHEMASVVVWIGYLQWRRDNGMGEPEEPILRVLTNIQHRDAIMELDANGNPRLDSAGDPSEPAWPKVDFIVSNPPFLGGKLLRRNLGDAYVDSLLKLYRERVPAEADLVTYWFEKARAMVERKQVRAVGLVATQGIRGGANREVLKRVAETGNIFMAWSDLDWINEGAAVHISIVGFDGSEEPGHVLNGAPVEAINPDLTSGSDATRARLLPENANLCFMGTTKAGSFDLDHETARRMLDAPLNPNGRPNSDVVRPWVNALDITRRPRGMYIVDFGLDMPEEQAALYEMPFEYVREQVYPERKSDNRDLGEKPKWLHARPRPELRAALANLDRYIATPAVSKHRTFVWSSAEVLPDHAVFAIARDDDYFFGVLHSRAHEVWARAQGTQLREVESGFRYTPTSTFETFPFPWSPGTEPKDSPLVKAIAQAARELVEQRDNWLNPPNAAPEELAKLTLTNLYNKRAKGKCAWLENAHRKLDKAVFAAYGWPTSLSNEEILSRLLILNHERAPVASA